MENTALLKKLINKFGEPIIKMAGIKFINKQPTANKCNEWIKAQPNPDGYLWYYDKVMDMFYIYETPDITDAQITNLLLLAQNELQIKKISKIHFWVKFWSIITIIGAFISAIILLSID